MSSNFCVTSPPRFSGENYQFWGVKMQSYLKALGLWELVSTDVDLEPLGENLTLNRIGLHEEKKLKPKGLSIIHASLSNPIFAKIIDCKTAKEALDKLQEEFEGSGEFEMLKMKDSDSVMDYTTKVMTIVNQIRLGGENFQDQRVVEKIMVSVPSKFESKISDIEESSNLTTLSIAELISKL
ncbi:uncharacterized protein LOC111023510 [Momordica charantia]|uniref:Uncharacterized protein LOC111023510 n=1 Tax=Momordica charantia TaxID=3673 RepID=A0A6J1DVL9_MOMCH|nr:uncharacterized protein LOC111023510 [Momordica charantia]